MPRIAQMLSESRQRLRSAPHAPPGREAYLLLAHVLGWSEAQVLARDDARVTAEQAASFDSLIERRSQGEPVAYLTGHKEFYGRSFDVDSRVLIPRPETEHLITAILDLELPPSPFILDAGAGSGCIAVTLALELPDARLVACDRSLEALQVAAGNALRWKVASRVRRVCSDWLSALNSKHLDLVAANPPYMARGNAAGISAEITGFEPYLALFAGDDGLDGYRRLFGSLEDLKTGTPVVAEIGQGQEVAVQSIAEESGFVHRRTVDDYAGIPRVVVVNRG